MTLETENTNFQTQIHIVSESPSLSFPKGLLLFSGQTIFIIISSVKRKRVFCYIDNCWQNSAFKTQLICEGTSPKQLPFNQEAFLTVAIYPLPLSFDHSQHDRMTSKEKEVI